MDVDDIMYDDFELKMRQQLSVGSLEKKRCKGGHDV